MPRHRTPHPDLASYVLGILEPAEASAFADHLAGCSACRAEVAELSRLPELLARAATATEPPPDLRARTLAAVEEIPTSPSRRPAGRTAIVAAAAATAAAAMFVVALAVGALLSGDADDVFTAELTAAAGGSDAAGTARLRSTSQGVVVELEVSGLVPTEGTHYECWYVDAGDGTTRVSAGSFVTKPDGTAKVRMVTAADPVRFPRIVVTREATDGDPSPGEPVLTSTASS
jgi:hypothetical protein